jgi:hypothetical protein
MSNLDLIIETYNREVDDLPNLHKNSGGGKARNASGLVYENLTLRTCEMLGLDARKNDYKKSKKTKSGKQIKNLQVDWHCYKEESLKKLVECKTYLDSCYLKRFVDDALDLHLSPEVPDDVEFAILAGQNACGITAFEYNLEKFSDLTGKEIDVFFVNPQVKRNSKKPIYKAEFRQNFVLDKVVYNEFIEWLNK